jgi:hypothetical protein
MSLAVSEKNFRKFAEPNFPQSMVWGCGVSPAVFAMLPLDGEMGIAGELSRSSRAEDIQLSPGIPDPILLVRQQAVHDLFVGTGQRVRQESFLFSGRWRNPDQIQIDSAQQCGLGGRTRRLQAFVLQFGGDESVNWIRGRPGARGNPRPGTGTKYQGAGLGADAAPVETAEIVITASERSE